MATIRLSILKSRQNADGSFNIKVAVSHRHVTRYIATNFNISKLSEWKDGRVVLRNDASVMNAKLRRLLDDYQTKLDSIPHYAMTCGQIREILQQSALYSGCTIQSYTDSVCNDMLAEGRFGYVENYKRSVANLINSLGGDNVFDILSPHSIKRLDAYMRKMGLNNTTINLRMSNVKALINSAIRDQVVKYEVHPFAYYSMPDKNVRDIDITIDELRQLRDMPLTLKRNVIARDMFMLSFYCAGMNLIDLLSATFPAEPNNPITFIRKKSCGTKKGEKRVSFTIQPEAYAIASKYIGDDRMIHLPYKYDKYENLRGYITASLRNIGKDLCFDKPLMFYSARKTFCQIGFDIGIPLYILEYSVGHSIKDAHNRPIYDYLRIMRTHADDAIRHILDVIL